MKTFADFNIQINSNSSGNEKALCPECSHTRKKTKDPCLSVDKTKGLWNCHNCGWTGTLNNGNGNYHKAGLIYAKPKDEALQNLSQKFIDWFKDRGISEATLKRNQISSGNEFMPVTGKEENVIQFPYFKNGEIVNIQSRARKKNFKLVKDAELIPYGYDDISSNISELIWVEGQIDKLSLEEAGFKNCVSVPNGAKSKLDFLKPMQDILKPIQKFVIAVDNDTEGKKLETELIRRLGPEKCFVTKWPDGCKDANDVLVKHGKEKLKEYIDRAKPFPIEGIHEVSDVIDDIYEFYHDGAKGGVPVEWLSMRKYYSVRPSEWTLITGIPSHGKSEFVDALMIGLAESDDWKFGVCSPENLPLQQHIAKLIEKYSRKPFLQRSNTRLAIEDILPSCEWVEDHFSFILPPENDLTVDGVLKLAKTLVYRKGIKGLIIDPWNELDHSRPANLSETEYISKSLSKIRRFARTYKVHIWLIAHPTKMFKTTEGKYPVPTPYDVSGSAHWRNKADNCISVWRDLSTPECRDVQIHIQKIRFKEVGKIGMAELEYDYYTGRYFDKNLIKRNYHG